MEEKIHDRRTAKTKRAIHQAFMEILSGKELSKVTVQEIADRADINRATFYRHYLDVYDLYDKVEQEILLDWSALILQLEDKGSSDHLARLVEYVHDNQAVFTMAFSPEAPGELRVKLYKALEGLFSLMMSEKLGTEIGNDKLSFQIRYRTEGCIAVLCKWVNEGFRQSPDFIEKLISELDANTEKIM